MKQISWFLLGMCVSLIIYTCSTNTEEITTQTTEQPTATLDSSGFDAPLAAELGADDYGMKKYILAFLKMGPNRNQSTEEVSRLQRAHLDNIGKLAEQRKLVVAGPFLDDGEVRGIYIFDVSSIEEAQALTETDPAIQAGRLIMELHEWYGSAALIKTAEIHTTISKKEI